MPVHRPVKKASKKLSAARKAAWEIRRQNHQEEEIKRLAYETTAANARAAHRDQALHALEKGATADQCRRILAGEYLSMKEWGEIETRFNQQHPQNYEETPVNAFGLQSNPKTLMGQQKVPVLSVVPPASILAQGTAMRYGAYIAKRADGQRGYGPYNWRDQPIEAHIYIDAAMRHLMQWFDGEDFEIILDDEGQEIARIDHRAFALATIGILIDAEWNKTMIDDRPKVRNQVATQILSAHKMKPSTRSPR